MGGGRKALREDARGEQAGGRVIAFARSRRASRIIRAQQRDREGQVDFRETDRRRDRRGEK